MKCEDVSADIDALLQSPGDDVVSKRLQKHFKECEQCRQELGDIINTAAKISEVGQISDFVDVSDDFIEHTREEARKESDRFRVSSIHMQKKRAQKMADYLIIALLVGTVIAAIIIFYLAVIFL